MKVIEFIENINNGINNEYVETYIPFQTKRIIARDALERASDDIDGFISLDHTMANVYFYMNLAREYFGMETDDVESDYDALMSVGFDLGNSVADDVSDAYKIFENEMKNLMAQNSVEAQMAKIVDSLVKTINRLSGKLEESIGDFNASDILPEGVDVMELLELIKKYK